MYRTKCAILRSRTRWHNGEKNTKYFLNQEKRHYGQVTISCLEKSENDFATTDKGIIHECESFFKDLYFFSENDTVLSNKERNSH